MSGALAAFDGRMGTGWGVLLIVAMIAMMGGMGWMMWSMMRSGGSHAQQSPEAPVEILKRRYARGELTTDEFREHLDRLTDPR